MNEAVEQHVLLLLPILAVAIILAAVLLLLIRRRRFGGDSVEQGLGPPPAVGSVQVCPSCRNPMRAGYVMSPRGLYWSGRDETFRGFLGSRWSPAMSNTLNPGFRAKGNRAWRCPSCRLILIDHSTLREISKAV